MLRDEWNSYYYVKESDSAVSPKKEMWKRLEQNFEEGTLIKSHVEKPLKSPRMVLKPSKMRRIF